MMVGYIASGYELESKTLIMGCLTGVFYFIGGTSAVIAYKTGPGGPISALINTQIIY